MIMFGVGLTTIIVISLVINQKTIFRLFPEEDNTVGIERQLLIILVFYIFFASIQGVLSGIIRGLGLQLRGSIYILICNYFIGLPLALWLAFNNEMGLSGLWLGFLIACLLIDIGLLIMIECADWQKISAKMETQIDKQKIKKIVDSVKTGQLLPDEEYAGMTGLTQSSKAL